MMRTGLLILIGAGGGVLVAAGVVALLVGLGIITRFAGISRTAVHTKLYESMILLGAVYGNTFTVYGMTIFKGRLMLAVLGLTAGMYVGAWIMALAEVINIFPIAARRIGLAKGISVIVIFLALGKTIGSLLYFYMGW